MEREIANLSLHTLIRECSKDPQEARKHYSYFEMVNRSRIHEVFAYKKFNDDFIDNLTVYNNGEYLIGRIRPCYDEFIAKLMIILNIKPLDKVADDDSLTRILLERVEVLKGITSEIELKHEFPYLYKDLQDGRRYIRNIEAQRDFDDNKEREEELADKEHYYYSCGLRRSLTNFVRTQSEVYKRFIERRHELKEKQASTSYNGYIVNNFDMNKVYMYTMHEYLRICEKSNDEELIKFYLRLIDKYLESDKDKNCYIITDENIRVDISSILIRIENLKRRISDNSNVVEWILVPEGKDYKRVRRAERKHEEKPFIFNYEEVQRLKNIGAKKKTFYEATPYIAKAVGLRRYRGYVAYIYANGKVILDREYNEDNPKTAVENAAYIIEARDFEELSKKEKTELIRDPKAQRKYHTKNFESKLNEIIGKTGTKKEQEEAKQLVLRLKTRR